MLFKLGHTRNASAYLGPYFLAFQAEALIRQAKHVDALSVMDQMMEELPSSSPLTPLYKAKHALMMLDSTDDEAIKKGLDTIESLSKDEANPFRDMAAYYLGSYYWSLDKVDQALQVWQELVQAQQSEKDAPSPWARAAEQKAKQII